MVVTLLWCAAHLSYLITLMIFSDPTVNVNNLNGAFTCMFQVIKHTILSELHSVHMERGVLPGVKVWSPPSSFLNAKLLDIVS